ncbi:MAG: TetR/AcrR family transcriptional regulator [Alphaproteobacteria bacterium]|nr:TetR/AcrR family transcriptional regulator [Alphaproteobacteria bacterium]
MRARRPAPSSTEAKRRYHHGDLRAALIAEALSIAATEGIEKVSVREVARRAGVSPGAPFRHFADKTALMTAVAEEAMDRFRAEIDAALAKADADDPIAGFRAVGRAFLSWAMRNPTHFAIISSRQAIDFPGSQRLVNQNTAIQELVDHLLQKALSAGRLRSGDTRLVQLAGRALVYGLARMFTDGHFESWHVPATEVETRMEAVLDLVVESLAKPPSDATTNPNPRPRSRRRP